LLLSTTTRPIDASAAMAPGRGQRRPEEQQDEAAEHYSPEPSIEDGMSLNSPLLPWVGGGRRRGLEEDPATY
jgi:hypothetical protein